MLYCFYYDFFSIFKIDRALKGRAVKEQSTIYLPVSSTVDYECTVDVVGSAEEEITTQPRSATLK